MTHDRDTIIMFLTEDIGLIGDGEHFDRDAADEYLGLMADRADRPLELGSSGGGAR